MHRLLVALVYAALLCGCLGATPPATKAADAARELNVASRFGKMDLATTNTAPAARQSFLERRRQWGGEIRILDVEMAGMQLTKPTAATIQVDFSWMRIDEGLLRTTRIEQSWSNVEGSWLLTRERRIAGDLGLFGEGIPSKPAPHKDVHFPSKTLGMPHDVER